jgi:hypothetical protein
MTLNERDLETAARRLGEKAAARLDVERTSGVVVERLKAARLAPWWSAPGLLRAAAIVVLALGVGLFYRPGGNGTPLVAGSPVTLQTLSVDELEEVLDSLVIEAPATLRSGGVGLADLDETQLTQLLEELKG